MSTNKMSCMLVQDHDTCNIMLDLSFAAMIRHIEDMAFIEIPHGNNSTDDTRAKRNAIRFRSALWPNARVPYFFAPDFSCKFSLI